MTLCADIGRLNRFVLIMDGKKEPVDKSSLFVWDNGKLVRFRKKGCDLVSKEYIYIHLQKRKMKVNLKDKAHSTTFKIIPNSFESLEIPIADISADTYSRICKYHFNMNYCRVRYNNLKAKLRRLFITNKREKQ